MPVKDALGNTQIVMSKVDVDEETLQKIAAETGGKFYRATDTDSLENIYAEINRLEKTTQTFKKFESHQELFAWALASRAGRARPGRRAGADAAIGGCHERNTINHTLSDIMKFAEPFWLLAGLAACALALVAVSSVRPAQRAALATFASPHLLAQLTRSFSAAGETLKRGLSSPPSAVSSSRWRGRRPVFAGKKRSAKASKSFSPWTLPGAC